MSSATNNMLNGRPGEGSNEGAIQIAQTASTADYGASRSGLRILLVDDSEDNRTLVQAYLKDCDCDISTAENGMDAVEKFVSIRPDIVFMDVQMPVMDGHAATRAIREWERERGAAATPIIALTAHALKEDAQRSIDAGCNGHITKPLKRERLMEVINEFTAGPDIPVQDDQPSSVAADPATKRERISIDPDIRDLIPGFLENRQRDITAISTAIEDKDFEGISLLGHSMKGSGGGYGFQKITDLGRSLEDAAHAENSRELRELVEELAAYLENVECIYE